MEKKCQRCGKIYPAERELSRYCSPTCRQYAYLERNGLRINRESETDFSTEEQKHSIQKYESAIDANSVNDVNDRKNEQETVAESVVPIERKKETVNPVNDAMSFQIGELMEQIRELKEQVAKNNQPQIARPDREKTFQELLEERLQLHNGENMFTKNNYASWKWNDFNNVNYVNERMKSYLTALLKFHKEGEAEYRHIKSIFNKMEELKNSYEYNHLPPEYPYKDGIINFSERLKKIIEDDGQDDEMKFNIRKSVRVEMKAMIIEIGNTTSDVDHCPRPKDPGDIRQNSYYLAAKRRGLDILNL